MLLCGMGSRSYVTYRPLHTSMSSIAHSTLLSMAKKKADVTPAFAIASSCVPPHIFGHVLRLLTLRDQCHVDIALSDRGLRLHWRPL